MATAAGIECHIDPLLFNSMNTNCSNLEKEGNCLSLFISLSLSLSLSPLLIKVQITIKSGVLSCICGCDTIFTKCEGTFSLLSILYSPCTSV